MIFFIERVLKNKKKQFADIVFKTDIWSYITYKLSDTQYFI